MFITVKIAFIFTSLSAVQICDFHIFTAVYSPLHGFIWNQHSDKLPVGLLAQLVEHCTSIAEVMGSNPIQAWIFFRPSFHYCLGSVYYCEDHFHIHILSLPIKVTSYQLFIWLAMFDLELEWTEGGREEERPDTPPLPLSFILTITCHLDMHIFLFPAFCRH